MIKHHGVNYSYTPAAVVYPDKAVAKSVREQARYLAVAHRKSVRDRQQSLLMGGLAEIGITAGAA